MPIFSQIELYLDNSYEIAENKSFIPRSRCSCNYLEQKLSELKFQTTFSRINIYLSKKENGYKVQPLKGVAILGVTINYVLQDVQNISDDDIQKHCVNIIERGLLATQDYMSVPSVECLSFLEDFRDNGFKNEWVQAEKEWKRKSLKCEVVASLTTEEFSLYQKIYEHGSLIAERLIAKTQPREIMFYDYLGNLSLDRLGVIQYKKSNQIISKFNTKEKTFIETECGV